MMHLTREIAELRGDKRANRQTRPTARRTQKHDSDRGWAIARTGALVIAALCSVNAAHALTRSCTGTATLEYEMSGMSRTITKKGKTFTGTGEGKTVYVARLRASDDMRDKARDHWNSLPRWAWVWAKFTIVKEGNENGCKNNIVWEHTRDGDTPTN